MTRRGAWFSLRASLWFIPTLVVVTAATGALVFIKVDQRFDSAIRQYGPDFLPIEAEIAQQILATIASSMITVAGVVFSITMVALSLTANQYSPRILRTFMRDRLNQLTLGIFTGGFVYSLLVLQAIDSQQHVFIPLISVWLAILVALVGIFFLIAFIHRTAASIQVADITAIITSETIAAMDSIQCSLKGFGNLKDVDKLKNFDKLKVHGTHQGSDQHAVPALKSGYVQDIDIANLCVLACQYKVQIQLECAVGDFIVEQHPLLWIYRHDNNNEPLESFDQNLQKCFAINSYRTIEQDPAFGIRQIVDIALRALSPGINDTTTAINCLDYLHVILHHALQMPEMPNVYWENGQPRLQIRQWTPEHLIDIALNEIRQNGKENVAVLLRLLRLIRQLLEDKNLLDEQLANKQDGERKRLFHHANLVLHQAKRSIVEPADQEVIAESFNKIAALMN